MSSEKVPGSYVTVEKPPLVGPVSSAATVVTPEYISAAATNCHDTATLIRQELDTLKKYVEQLQDQWHGVAAGSFGALMHNYDTFGNMLYNALNDIGSGLQGNYVNYEATEEANVKSLVAVDGDIPGAYL
ncbi:WXG100 family type VII secretion target [Dactylosporangium sp. NPDC000244]|uniref:WXG100 family type VII secretion target n=1 Tax=Dactylosporangium sp. NPDC000244 TaxID=3154365 RepID=UPI00331CA786